MITLGVLISAAIVLTIYTACAHMVALAVHEIDGVALWPTPGYTFLPWPTTPAGRIVIQMTVPLNQTDLLYYQYIIRSGVLIALTFLLWIAVVWKVLKFRKTRLPEQTT